MIQFYALPTWELATALKKNAPRADPLVPSIATEPGIVVAALARAEFAGAHAIDHAETVLDRGEPFKVFARPPNNLPALLRLADELLRLARQIEGLPPRTWQCSCGTRYSVPAAVLVPMSIRCERCGRTIELEPERSAEADLPDPEQARINAYRGALSEFFREAMARGWAVLVKRV